MQPEPECLMTSFGHISRCNGQKALHGTVQRRRPARLLLDEAHVAPSAVQAQCFIKVILS